MIPCIYCGGSPALRHYEIDVPDYHHFFYRVTCTRCGASTDDSMAKGSARTKWERGDIMKMTVVEDVPLLRDKRWREFRVLRLSVERQHHQTPV